MGTPRHSLGELKNAHNIICNFLEGKSWVKKDSILIYLADKLNTYKRSTIDRLLRATVHFSQETHEDIDIIISSEKGYKIATLSTELLDESQKRRLLATTYEELTISLVEKAQRLKTKESATLQTA